MPQSLPFTCFPVLIINHPVIRQFWPVAWTRPINVQYLTLLYLTSLCWTVPFRSLRKCTPVHERVMSFRWLIQPVERFVTLFIAFVFYVNVTSLELKPLLSVLRRETCLHAVYSYVLTIVPCLLWACSCSQHTDINLSIDRRAKAGS
jgi:hypothetical protein